MAKNQISFRASDDEMNKLKVQADGLKVTVSDLVRALVFASRSNEQAEAIETGFAFIVERLDELETKISSPATPEFSDGNFPALDGLRDQIAGIAERQNQHDAGLAAIVRAIEKHMAMPTPARQQTEQPAPRLSVPEAPRPTAPQPAAIRRAAPGHFMEWYSNGPRQQRPEATDAKVWRGMKLKEFVAEFGHDPSAPLDAYEAAGMVKPS